MEKAKLCLQDSKTKFLSVYTVENQNGIRDKLWDCPHNINWGHLFDVIKSYYVLFQL